MTPILTSDDHPTGANRAAIKQRYISNECLAGHHDRCEDPMDCSCPCHEDDE